MSCKADLTFPEVADLLGEPLRFGSGAAEFGLRRSKIGSGYIVGTPRDTGTGSEGDETQHPDCCGVNLFASFHGVVLSAIAQNVAPL